MSDPSLTLDKLKQALLKLEESDNPERAHRIADAALLSYINDAEVTRLFKAIERWYA